MQVFWASVFSIPKTVIKDINKDLKGFLWCQGELTKGKAKVAWDKICTPKDQGGLGLKSLQVWNEVLMIKQLWNIAAKKDSLWVKWVNVEKLKGRNIWEVSCEKNCSSGWKSILNLRDKVRKHIFFKLRNGKTTSAWYDKWCLEGPLCDFLSARDIYDARFKVDYSVADIIKQGEWCWPAEWLDRYPQLSNIKVPDLNDNDCDEAMWVTDSGVRTKYKTKTVWNDISGSNNGAKVKWCSMIWFSQCIPRHTFVLWMAVQERLMTQDKIAKWRMNEVLECTLCKKCMDSHEHLFFNCEYSSAVWNELQAFLDKRFSNN